jgi:hypothetical protein
LVEHATINYQKTKKELLTSLKDRKEAEEKIEEKITDELMPELY